MMLMMMMMDDVS
jgi:hypothetical protein